MTPATTIAPGTVIFSFIFVSPIKDSVAVSCLEYYNTYVILCTYIIYKTCIFLRMCYNKRHV